MSMCKTTLAPGQRLHSVHTEQKLPWQKSEEKLPGVAQRVTHLLKLPQGKEKFM